MSAPICHAGAIDFRVESRLLKFLFRERLWERLSFLWRFGAGGLVGIR